MVDRVGGTRGRGRPVEWSVGEGRRAAMLSPGPVGPVPPEAPNSFRNPLRSRRCSAAPQTVTLGEPGKARDPGGKNGKGRDGTKPCGCAGVGGREGTAARLPRGGERETEDEPTCAAPRGVEAPPSASQRRRAIARGFRVRPGRDRQRQPLAAPRWVHLHRGCVRRSRPGVRARLSRSVRRPPGGHAQLCALADFF